jgi:arylsulfatase A-like enzyme
LNLLGQFSAEERQNILNSTYKHTIFPDQLELYNLRNDPGETKNIADMHPEIVKEIMDMAEKEKSALGEYTSKGPEVRKTMMVENPKLVIR